MFLEFFLFPLDKAAKEQEYRAFLPIALAGVCLATKLSKPLSHKAPSVNKHIKLLPQIQLKI